MARQGIYSLVLSTQFACKHGWVCQIIVSVPCGVRNIQYEQYSVRIKDLNYGYLFIFSKSNISHIQLCENCGVIGYCIPVSQ
jgi:hypothetical protein